MDITQFNVLTFRTDNLGQGEIRVVAESSSVRAVTGITLIRNNIDQLLVQASAATVLRSRTTSQFPGIIVSSYDYLTLAAFDDNILQWGRVIRYGVLNNQGLLSIDSHANTDTIDIFRSTLDTTITANLDFQIFTDGDIEMVIDSTLTITSFDTTIAAADNVLFYYNTEFVADASEVLTFATTQESFLGNDVRTNFQKIQFNGIASNQGYRFPTQDFEHPNKPRVTFDAPLFLHFRNAFSPEQEAFQRGGACLYDRALVFGHSQGNRNLCICIDNVWMCGEDDYFYLYQGDYPNKYYMEPQQNPYGGTGPL
jgi:hypothetical protein